MMGGDFWLLGIFVLFGLACFGLAFVKNKREFITRILYTIIPTGKKDLFGNRPFITARSGNCSIRCEPAKDNGWQVIKITVESQKILPPPLAIADRGEGRFERELRGFLVRPNELAAVRERLGKTDAGLLSLAGNSGDSGELSLTDETGNVRLKRPENDSHTGGVSDE